MHSIASFCRKHRLPQRRVLREVKRALRDHVDLETRGWGVDLSEQAGVQAHRAEEAKRVTYEVTDPERLRRWLAAEIGVSLLEPRQIEQIAQAARQFWRFASNSDEELMLCSRKNGQIVTFKQPYLDELDAVLKQMNT